MNKQIIKQFLKPDRRKIGLMIGIIVLCVFLVYSTAVSPPPVLELIFLFLFLPDIVIMVLSGYRGQHDLTYTILMQIVSPLMVIVYWYILSCLTIFIYDKLKIRKRWFVLILLLVGLLISIVLWQFGSGPGPVPPKIYSGFEQFHLDDWTVDCSTGELRMSLSLTNVVGDRAEDVACATCATPRFPDDPEPENPATDSGLAIDKGETRVVTCTDTITNINSSMYRLDVKIYYNDSVTGLGHIDTGWISGPCE